jgi:pimeloyl-ACP methyl ester carboxylesterase
MAAAERESVQRAMTRLLEAGGVEWRSVWTEHADVRVHHVEAGSGSPVVLLHGGSGGGANWFRVLGPLSQHYRVLAPDLPGFGLSDAVEPQRPLGQMAAAALERWLEHCQLRDVAVVGTSFGGLAAARLAQRTRRVTRLLLLDAAGLGRGIHPTVRMAASSPVASWTVRPSRRGTTELFRRLLTSDRSELTADQQELLVDYLFASSAVAGTAYLKTTLRLFCGPRGQREVLSVAELSALTLPVAVIWGERDRLLPVRHARRASAALPDATLDILTGVGHSPNWESAAMVVAAIRALARRTHRAPLHETPAD